MKVRLIQGPEGAPNSSFGLYDIETGECLEFIQSDWEWASLASSFGWIPCEHGECGTDGTVSCKHKTVGQMLSEAFDYLAERDGDELDWRNE